MSIRIHLSGAAEKAANEFVPVLTADFVASRITDQDPTLWGKAAEAEASIRLSWVQSAFDSRALVDEIVLLRSQLHAKGVNRVVLAGMGGSSLAPEVITNTAGADLTILDSTAPGQVAAALVELERTVLVVSSKSGSTVETDSQRRVFEKAFRDLGIDPVERIVIVTDPGSPLDASARSAGYRVFNADPNVGGRFSALTAFGLVPSGLAGVDIAEILDEAEAAALEFAIDDPANPTLALGAAITKAVSGHVKLGLITDGTHLVGFPDWVEQLVAESTGKDGKGILPVVLDVVSSELNENLPDLQIVRLVDDAHEHHLLHRDKHEGEILVSGSLGAMFLAWEYATSIAGYLMKINPFDQPDVESAKIAARAFLDERPAPTPASFTDAGIEVRQHGEFLGSAATVREAVTALLETVPSDGYIAVQAYLDRDTLEQVSGVRDLVAARAARPVTFGWGPRFLHSTGQYHKGGPAIGCFIQILQNEDADLEIPERPFTFGQLIQAQASGDAQVLADHGRPVLTLTLPAGTQALLALFEAFN